MLRIAAGVILIGNAVNYAATAVPAGIRIHDILSGYGAMSSSARAVNVWLTIANVATASALAGIGIALILRRRITGLVCLVLMVVFGFSVATLKSAADDQRRDLHRNLEAMQESVEADR